MGDVGDVGGKNASLGEMIKNLSAAGITVPNGFATTADAFRTFLHQSGLDTRIQDALAPLDVGDTQQLARTGEQIRQWIIETPLPNALEQAISDAYAYMTANAGGAISVAVRSSATAEDLPEASFAGQQE
ncbi:MAG TPA: phosphoenolpyruvate synthase, partial [Gammaproteobacteria bacterium]|nr:phosphoenolpyruvate synthase [Gammaproteobacteria bacterium]